MASRVGKGIYVTAVRAISREESLSESLFLLIVDADRWSGTYPGKLPEHGFRFTLLKYRAAFAKWKSSRRCGLLDVRIDPGRNRLLAKFKEIIQTESLWSADRRRRFVGHRYEKRSL